MLTHKLFYKYPGSQITYLDGKTYDLREVPEYEEAQALAEGWSRSPDEAEIVAAKAAKKG